MFAKTLVILDVKVTKHVLFKVIKHVLKQQLIKARPL